jgi:Carboxypeptidase regulatory-like domain/Bacterial Ig domain
MAMAVTGCTTSPFSTASPPSTGPMAQGHIHGTFTLTAGPVPTCTGQSPCPSGYLQAEKDARITVRRPDGTVAATATTNASGVFALDVSPGTYTLSAPQQEEPGRYSATVTVNSGATVIVNLQITEP